MKGVLRWAPLVCAVLALFGGSWVAVVYARPLVTVLLGIDGLALFAGAIVTLTRPQGFQVFGASGLLVGLFLGFGVLLGAGGSNLGIAVATVVCVTWAGTALALAWTHALRAVFWAAADPGRRPLDLAAATPLPLSDAILGRLGVIGFLDLVRTYDSIAGHRGADALALALPLAGAPREAAAAFVDAVVRRDGNIHRLWKLVVELDPEASQLGPRIVELEDSTTVREIC